MKTIKGKVMFSTFLTLALSATAPCAPNAAAQTTTGGTIQLQTVDPALTVQQASTLAGQADNAVFVAAQALDVAAGAATAMGISPTGTPAGTVTSPVGQTVGGGGGGSSGGRSSGGGFSMSASGNMNGVGSSMSFGGGGPGPMGMPNLFGGGGKGQEGVNLGTPFGNIPLGNLGEGGGSEPLNGGF